MAVNRISEIKNAIGQGVRPNLFRVSFASDAWTQPEGLSFLVKAAALPASTLGVVDVAHMSGRRYKLGGDRTFADWTTTVLTDPGYNVRKALEDYQAAFVNVDYETGTVNQGAGNRGEVDLTTVTVEQFNADGSVQTTYKLQNAWISEIGATNLSYDNTDTIEEFTVTWVYDYHTVTRS